MGLYDYNCKNCGDLTLNLSMKEIPLKECPKCNCTEIERVFNPTPIIWKCDGAFGKNNKG